jgi:hypothetical protein
LLHGKVQHFVAGEIASEHKLAPGIIQVCILLNLEGYSPLPIRDAIDLAVEAKLEITTLPGPYQHIMYIVQDCYIRVNGTKWQDNCGFAAYALVNGWRLLYRTGFYNYAATLMHELGHNFNLGHSGGGLDNLTYTDHTCLVSASVVCISCITTCALPMYNFFTK